MASTGGHTRACLAPVTMSTDILTLHIPFLFALCASAYGIDERADQARTGHCGCKRESHSKSDPGTCDDRQNRAESSAGEQERRRVRHGDQRVSDHRSGSDPSSKISLQLTNEVGAAVELSWRNSCEANPQLSHEGGSSPVEWCSRFVILRG